jgi:hypothetical protein
LAGDRYQDLRDDAFLGAIGAAEHGIGA